MLPFACWSECCVGTLRHRKLVCLSVVSDLSKAPFLPSCPQICVVLYKVSVLNFLLSSYCVTHIYLLLCFDGI